MSKAGAEWSDQQILGATKQEFNEKGTHKQFQVTLPDGSLFTSEFMDPGQIKASTLISWCEAVRGAIGAKQEAQLEEMAAKRARRKSGVPIADGRTSYSPASPTTKPDTVNDTEDKTSDTVTSSSVTDGTQLSPDDYVRQQYERTAHRLKQYQEDGQRILARIKELQIEHDKWKAIYEQLGDSE